MQDFEERALHFEALSFNKFLLTVVLFNAADKTHAKNNRQDF